MTAKSSTDRRILARQLLAAEAAFTAARERHELVHTELSKRVLAEARKRLETIEARAKWVSRGES